MRYFLLSVLLVPAGASAAILPETIGAYQRGTVGAPAVSDQAVWAEYGLKNSETATYENGRARFTATAWQLNDTTGALAAFEWQRPPKATPSAVASLAAETADALWLVHGNYLLAFQGYKPVQLELNAVAENLKNVDNSALPTLPGFLPAENLVPNSQRYLTGPAALGVFLPSIPASVAGFSMGAEAALGVFHSPKGDMKLAVFSYPTHQIAMQKITEFQGIQGALAKRTGPLIAVLVSPPDPDAAEHLLGAVRYQAEVTRDERVPTRKDNIGDLVINAFVLIGILLVFSVVSGFAFGGYRALLRRGKGGAEPEPMITLHLEGR